MDFNFYCCGKDKKLHQFLISDADDLQSARQTVIEYLHNSKEIFLKPILCLIKSNKIPSDVPKDAA